MGALIDMPEMQAMAQPPLDFGQFNVGDSDAHATHATDPIAAFGNASAPAQPAALPIISSDALFDVVMRFNLFPVEYADRSWLVAVDEGLARWGLGDLATSQRAAASPLSGAVRGAAQVKSAMWMRHMSTALLRLRELDRQYDFDYSDTGKRVALLATTSLLSLCRQAAALLARPILQRLIRGDEVAAVDAVIGRALRVHTLAQQAVVEHISTALADVQSQACGAMLNAEAWRTLPMQIALSVLPENAAAARARLRFRFPHDQRHVSRLKLDEMQRRQLVQVCLVAAQALNDAAVDALLRHRAVAEMLTTGKGRIE